ncbi:hypothetical protein ACU1JV_26655 [Paenibacillus sp. T2-29]
MRELNMGGGKTVRVKATPLALLFYKQEFKADLLADLLKSFGPGFKPGASDKIDPTKFMERFDTILILQIVWAMAKADAFGKQFPSFPNWLSEFDDLDVYGDFLKDALEEAGDGFFRKGRSKPNR